MTPTRTPDESEGIVEVFLAQADSLRRLRREDDAARKLAIARSIALECIQSNPNSALAMLIGARVSRASGQLDFAESLLRAAARLELDDRISHNIVYEQGQIRRERDIAGGNRFVMAQQLIIY